jgi:peptidoglycan/LPS O-acetylase OafA/YrhL
MKTALYGRIVFGASAVLFGVIALMGYDSDTWQTLRQIWSLPFGTIIGGCLMTVQIAGGIGMQHPRTARLASIVLGVVFLLLSLACIPGIIPHPPSMCITGASSNSFPHSAARLPCTLQLKRMKHGP